MCSLCVRTSRRPADPAVRTQVWHTEIPVWALLLAIALPVTYIVPSGYVYALTGQNVSFSIGFSGALTRMLTRPGRWGDSFHFRLRSTSSRRLFRA